MDKTRIIGGVVIHKNLGKARIVDIDDNYIYVQYNIDGENAPVKQLKFPDSFFGSEPFLKTKNKELKSTLGALKEKEVKHTCRRCGKHMEYYSLLGFCSDCLMKMVTCVTCGKRVFPEEAYNEYSNYYYCLLCKEKYFTKCSACGETVKKDETRSYKYYYGGKPICEFCCVGCRCDRCKTLLSKKYYRKIDTYIILCPDCFANHISTCEICEKTMIEDEECERQLCNECKLDLEYKEYFNQIDIAVMSVEYCEFYYFKRMRTKSIMSRLHPSYKRIYPKDSTPIDALILQNLDKDFIVLSKEYMPEKFRGKWDKCITVTELKKTGLYFLYDKEILFHKETNDKRSFFLFKSPCRLDAHTIFDEDYRKEYHGDNLVYEGNNYGDTTAFYIIGFFE